MSDEEYVAVQGLKFPCARRTSLSSVRKACWCFPSAWILAFHPDGKHLAMCMECSLREGTPLSRKMSVCSRTCAGDFRLLRARMGSLGRVRVVKERGKVFFVAVAKVGVVVKKMCAVALKSLESDAPRLFFLGACDSRLF